jgi:Folylpolyglutamate synthase
MNAFFLFEDKPTLFELITAAAFMIIAEEDADIAVVEAGLGGRLDATNILKNVVLTLITPIGMDHMEYLGETIRSIAYEKFSVMRKNTPALFADKDAELGGYFMEMASKARACGHLMSDMCLISNVTTSLDGTVFSLQTQDGERCYTTPLTGLYQAENAALAIMGAQMIKDGFGKISETAISEGIKRHRGEADWKK